ncbi:MAG: hypothetical protein JSV88_22480 [Candidatus Aminicenantes bacterium]|nr:MAG: hypothetical protein JSV88_22480 [Candidatus Aminicenantes bacterium]
MSKEGVEKAKEFLTFLTKNKKVAEKMKGWTLEDLRQAADELKADGIEPDPNFNPHYPI